MIQLRQLQEDFIILEKNIKVWENQLTNILIRNFPIRCIDTYMNYNQKKENKQTWIIYRDMVIMRINNYCSVHFIENTSFALYTKCSIRNPSEDWLNGYT